MRLLTLVTSVAAVLAGCQAVPGSGDLPLETDSSAGILAEPTFLVLDPAAPPLATTTVSFYAVRGETRQVELWYRPRAGEADSNRLARLKVPDRSLVSRADGTPLAVGDSLLITLTVVDPDRQIIDIQPSGLMFAPHRPAQLTLWYHEADVDYNQDGVVDRTDSALERTFVVWAQEDGAPWVPLSTDLATRVDEAEVDIPGFTRYAVAY